jgi:hypothetical protein
METLTLVVAWIMWVRAAAEIVLIKRALFSPQRRA